MDVRNRFWEEPILSPGVLKELAYIIEIVLTNVPVTVLARPWSSLPMLLELLIVDVCPVCWMCTWMGEGHVRCSFYCSLRVLDVYPMYSLLQAISAHW